MENFNSQNLLQQILKRLEELASNQTNAGISPEHVYLDNQEFMQLLKISPRTSQSYRDSGYISFSQIGSKIYYRLADIHEMLEKHKRKAFKS